MKVVVVGAGVGGLACAHALSERGVDVTVLESATRPGGLLRSERRGEWLCEWGANAFLQGGRAGGASDLCERLGVPLTKASPRSHTRWLFRDGRLRRAPLGPLALLTTDLLSWRGKARLLAEPFTRAGDPAADESVAAFVARRFGDEAARVMAGPLVQGIFAGEPDELAMAAAFPRLAALERDHGSVIRGAIAAMRAARGGPRRPRGSFAPADGTDALPRALATRLGDRLRLGVRVTRVERDRERSTVRNVDTGGTLQPPITCDHVVLATPSRITAALCAPLDLELGALTDVPVARVALGYAGFRRQDLPRPLEGFGVLIARGEPVRVLGVVFESELFAGRAPADHVLLRLIYGGARDPAAVALSDDGLRDVARADLEQLFGLRATPSFWHVVRPHEGIPQPRPGHVARVAAADARAAALGLSLVGNAWHGVSVNDVVDHAQAVAQGLR
jgi:oxygen-dependent protoporphyrinogen oxidase